MKYVLIFIFSFFPIIAHCFLNDVPRCSDPDVVETVKEIASEDQIKELNLIATPLIAIIVEQKIMVFEQLQKTLGADSERLYSEDSENLELLKKLFDYFSERKYKKSAINQIASVDTFSLKMIVTNKREHDISKCNCGARLIWAPFSDSTKMTTDITYDVQYTDDGEGFVVTVYGLSGFDVGSDEDDEDD